MNDMSASWQDFVKCAYAVSTEWKPVKNQTAAPSSPAKTYSSEGQTSVQARNPSISEKRTSQGNAFSSGKKVWPHGTAWSCNHPECNVSFPRVNPKVGNKMIGRFSGELRKSVEDHVLSHVVKVDRADQIHAARERARKDPKVQKMIQEALARILSS